MAKCITELKSLGTKYVVIGVNLIVFQLPLTYSESWNTLYMIMGPIYKVDSNMWIALYCNTF